MKGFTITIPATIDDWAGAINETNGLQASGAGTLSSAAAAGDTSLAIAGGTASKVLSAGSVIQIAGVNGRFEVTSDEAADGSGNLASTAIAPSIPKPIPSGTAVFWEQTVIPVDGLETAATYPRGTRLTIAGDSTVYTVAQAFTTSAGGADVRLTQGLQSAPADNAVVTFQPAGVIGSAADGPAGILTFYVSGIAGGTVLTPEGTVDDVTWDGVGIVPTDSTTMATTISADGMYRLDATGFKNTRLRVTTAGTGTVTVTVLPSVG